MSLQALLSPRRYYFQLSELQRRYGKSPRLHQVQSHHVSLARLIQEKRTVAKKMAQSIRAGTYEHATASLHTVFLDKPREVVSLTATDLVLHRLVADVITRCIESQLSPRVYSYRRRRSSWQAAQDMARYVRDYTRTRSDPRERGLYVLRGDIAQYGDSIPVHAGSRLWLQLLDALSVQKGEGELWKLVQEVIRPTIHNRGQFPWKRFVGIPTGSPVANPLTNLYLDPLDQVLSAIPEGFYARYGDDIVFAHEDPCVVRQISIQCERLLRDLDLRFNRNKLQLCYFNGAGRRSDREPHIQASTSIEYLGCRIDFSGTVGLTKKKYRWVVRELRDRLSRSSQLIGHAPLERQGKLLCQVANSALHPTSKVRIVYADLLRNVVTDRGQLKQMDYSIARMIVQLLTGTHNVRGFRQVPYQRMRKEWQLVSLVQQRNQGMRS